jgi:lysophospholipase L1-like esterase
LRVAFRERSAAPTIWGAHGLVHLAVLLFVSLLFGCGHDTPTSPTTLSLSCPASFSANSPDGQPLVVTYPPPLPLGGTAPVTVSCAPVSGASFPLNATTVQCTATDRVQRRASCSFTVTVVPPPYVKYARYLAFGDSLTAGQDGIPLPRGIVVLVDRPEIAYPTRLKEILLARYTAQTAKIDVVNKGISGESAAAAVTRLPKEIASVQPEVVLLLDGANDIFGNNAAGIPIAASALRTMVQDTRSRGLTAFLATLPPQDPTKPRGASAALVVPLNDEIKKIAVQEGAVLVDLYAGFNGDLTLLGPDGLHPNESGYLRMAQTFALRIRETLEIPFPGVSAAFAGGPGTRRP